MTEPLNIPGLKANPTIIGAMIAAVESCFSMCDLAVRPVGITTIPSSLPNGKVTGMIGANGNCTGFMMVNFPERVATQAVSGLLQDEFSILNHQVIDGVGELTNIISGGIKSKLASTPWSISSITVPSVIVGSHYDIAFSRGIEYTSITIEVDDPETMTIMDRVFMVTTSLMQVKA